MQSYVLLAYLGSAKMHHVGTLHSVSVHKEGAVGQVDNIEVETRGIIVEHEAESGTTIYCKCVCWSSMERALLADTSSAVD